MVEFTYQLGKKFPVSDLHSARPPLRRSRQPLLMGGLSLDMRMERLGVYAQVWADSAV
jgi:hypothetical protein